MYGIDFGTSNTVVTVKRDGVVRLLDLGEGGVIPSLLYFEKGRRPSVGAEAMRDYAEALERNRGQGNLYARFRFFQALKLGLKDPSFAGTRLFGDFLKPEELVAIFLREVKRRADEVSGLGPEEAARVVLGRPVRLSPDPEAEDFLQARFARACRLAGFSEIGFVPEPVAAAVHLAFASTKGAGDAGGAAAAPGAELGEGELLLVFDFGGGTLDITVARRRGGGLEILANEGADLGGYLLNEDLARARILGHFGAGGKFRTMTGRWLEIPSWITRQVASFYALPLADIAHTRNLVKDLVGDARREDKPKLRGLVEFLDRNLAFGLFGRIDAAKIALSEAESAAIAFAVPPHIAFEERVARAEFELLAAPRVAAARALVESCLGAAGVEAGAVSRVVRVGGSSLVPAFAAMLEGLFPGRVAQGAVFTSIAAGLLDAAEAGLATPAPASLSG